MSIDRLPTEFWVSSQLRQFNSQGIGAYLLRRGDSERGAVIVQLIGNNGTRILTQVRDLDGRLTWMGVKDGAVLGMEEAQAYIERAVARDSDLWIIEVETKAGENPFDTEIPGL